MEMFTLPTTVQMLLPTWEEMTDLDKGAALLHVAKRATEADDYAISDSPCRYLDHPQLTTLTPTQASAHAAQVCGYGQQPDGDFHYYDDVCERIGEAEADRLYDLAAAAERSRR